MRYFIEIIVAIGICQLAGIFGSIYTMPKIHNWYAALRKPSFQPPGWLFGPVWVTLYCVMAVAVIRIWDLPESTGRTSAMIFFIIQLILNALWSYLFFGLEEPWLAFKEIAAMWIFILLTMISFFSLDALAGWLFVPYLAWVTFAAVLNFSIARLNPKTI